MTRVESASATRERNEAAPSPRGNGGQLLGRHRDDQLGQQRGELLLHAHVAPSHPPGRGHPLPEGLGDVLEGAVLQQARKEQVAGLDQGQVLLVLGTDLWEQPGRLEVQECGRDQEELRGLREIPAGLGLLGRLDVGDELVGDLGQGNFGDVELVLGDEPDKQVERSGKDIEMDLECRRGSPPGDDTPRRGGGDDGGGRRRGRRDGALTHTLRPRRRGR